VSYKLEQQTMTPSQQCRSASLRLVRPPHRIHVDFEDLRWIEEVRGAQIADWEPKAAEITAHLLHSFVGLSQLSNVFPYPGAAKMSFERATQLVSSALASLDDTIFRSLLAEKLAEDTLAGLPDWRECVRGSVIPSDG
jgi:hypothetical protein